MSFLTFRRNSLHNNTLSLKFFGEDAVLTRRSNQNLPLRCKVTHRQAGNVVGRQAGQAHPNTVDELEQIEVLFSRDASWEFGGLATKPDPGEQLLRSPERDADRRPFLFAGEVMFEGDIHAVYVFQRPKRFVQGAKR